MHAIVSEHLICLSQMAMPLADGGALSNVSVEISSRLQRCNMATAKLVEEIVDDERELRNLDAELFRVNALLQSLTDSIDKAPQQSWQASNTAPSSDKGVTLIIENEPFRLTSAQLAQPAVRGSRLAMLVDAEGPFIVSRQPAAFRLVYRFLQGDIPAGSVALRVLLNELDFWRVDASNVRAKLLG